MYMFNDMVHFLFLSTFNSSYNTPNYRMVSAPYDGATLQHHTTLFSSDFRR